MSLSHDTQKEKWNEEHQTPHALKQMDARSISGGVVLFLEFLQEEGKNGLVGLEMACGKGRNVIGLAQEKVISKMYGFDFSSVAIEEAMRRAKEEEVFQKTHFEVMDAIEPWKFQSNFFDFGVDCFGSTDIESVAGRNFAVSEMHRVLKPGGYLFLYMLSPEDEFHQMMIQRNPAEESNAFYNENGKFEKSFSGEELDRMYKDFTLVEARRVGKTAEFFGKLYRCLHHWRIYRK